ncbi:lipase family protein [Gordonia insulae]|uniref:Putative inactive lipase n=1 Tax=Gordonia insulae TaxID=2420509 RepID=A0A3G8JJ59_9ACTN|nr:lipase family protein [Gordonia insulae]AZG45064.1 putative inactive lipase [Gordonia insulae]
MIRRCLLVVGAAFALICGVVSTPSVAQATPLPSADPFYRPGADLAAARPGAVLRTRPVAFVTSGVTVPVTATQVLYRSNDDLGAPIAGMTTILRPATANGRIVSFHMAYDALGPQCDPSYTLQGNKPSRAGQFEEIAIGGYLAAGYTVVVPDYEGQQQEWTIGRQSGHLALDGIRAAESVLRVPRSTPVGMVGYSGGSVPTGFAAELAPKYAPELAIVGAAAGGVPVNLAHNLPYISGSKDWAGVMPALVVAYQRAYGLDLSSFLSPYGLRLVNTVSNQCIIDFAADYPGLTDGQMVRAPYRGFLQVPSVRAAIARNVMGSVGRPRVPMMLGVGQKDSIGDGVMVTADVAGLARRYCAQGVPTQFHRYGGDSHSTAFIPFERDAAIFLNERFAGRPTGGC